jgi:16S rRNA (guanine527-N7)-methyltransferase
MTEDEAQGWLRDVLGVSRETLGRLDAFREMVIAENFKQNLVSGGSIPYFWVRHIVDSAQLLIFLNSHEDTKSRSLLGEDSVQPPQEDSHADTRPFVSSCLRASLNWLDLGTGAGFPGMVIAILQNTSITFVESRRRRVEFLRDSAQTLGLDHVSVALCQLEAFQGGTFDVISARAFAPLERLFPLAHRFSTAKTQWLLPKGRSAASELESIAKSWHGMFHVKHSVTDSDSSIIIGTHVMPKGAA